MLEMYVHLTIIIPMSVSHIRLSSLLPRAHYSSLLQNMQLELRLAIIIPISVFKYQAFQLAATSISSKVLNESKQTAIHALLADPLVENPNSASSLVDTMIEFQKDYLGYLK